ncbi:MAG TPA: hypothetical protein VI758_13755 [Bacteroidota bacterium]
MKKRTVIMSGRDCFVEVMHHLSDPNSWVVNRWQGMMFFRTRISSNWFIDKQQAFTFAGALRRAHEERTKSAKQRET